MRKFLTTLALTSTLVVATASESSACWWRRHREAKHAPVCCPVQTYTPYTSHYRTGCVGSVAGSPVNSAVGSSATPYTTAVSTPVEVAPVYQTSSDRPSSR